MKNQNTQSHRPFARRAGMGAHSSLTYTEKRVKGEERGKN